MKTMGILTAVTALLVGCTSTKKEPETRRMPQFMPVTDLGGTYVEPSQLECLRLPEVAKGYSIGRFIDPMDATVMHERSVVYRVEDGAAWNLQANRPVDVPFDGTPKAHVYRDERELRAEITAKANKQREYYQMMRAAQIRALSKMEAFKKTVEQARKLAQMNTNLIEEIRTMKKHDEKLESEVKQLNDKLKVVLEFQKLSDEDETRYKYLNKR
jgi:hypothetical protein